MPSFHRTLFALVLSTTLFAFACDEEPTPVEVPETETEVTDEVAQEATEAEPTAEEVPIAEDFADEAEDAITAENYAEELDQLAAEIEGELGGDEG